MKRILSALTVLTAGGSIALALGTTPVEPEAVPPIDVPASPKPVLLSCETSFEETMGEGTAGIEVETTEPVYVGRAYALGGTSPSLDGEPLEGTGDLSSWAGERTSGDLTVDVEDSVALAAGVTERIQERGELAGLAITACQEPSSGHVIVGGSTGLSESSQLVLSNSSTSGAQVTIEVMTSTGLAPTTPISSVTVGAGDTETVMIQAGVLDSRIALTVRSTGGKVSAHLLTHGVDGIDGTGAATVSPGAEPATHLVVPGTDFDSTYGQPRLRVANPQEEATTVTLSALDSDGLDEIDGSIDVEVPAGTVLDIPVDSAGSQWGAVVVDAADPVMAGLSVTGEHDIAWFPAVAPTTTAVATLGQATYDLSLSAPGGASVTGTFYDKEGDVIETKDIAVDPTFTEQVPDGTMFVHLESDDPFHPVLVATTEIAEDRIGIESLPLTVPPAGTAKSDAVVDN